MVNVLHRLYASSLGNPSVPVPGRVGFKLLMLFAPGHQQCQVCTGNQECVIKQGAFCAKKLGVLILGLEKIVDPMLDYEQNQPNFWCESKCGHRIKFWRRSSAILVKKGLWDLLDESYSGVIHHFSHLNFIKQTDTSPALHESAYLDYFMHKLLCRVDVAFNLPNTSATQNGD